MDKMVVMAVCKVMLKKNGLILLFGLLQMQLWSTASETEPLACQQLVLDCLPMKLSQKIAPALMALNENELAQQLPIIFAQNAVDISASAMAVLVNLLLKSADQQLGQVDPLSFFTAMFDGLASVNRYELTQHEQRLQKMILQVEQKAVATLKARNWKADLLYKIIDKINTVTSIFLDRFYFLKLSGAIQSAFLARLPEELDLSLALRFNVQLWQAFKNSIPWALSCQLKERCAQGAYRPMRQRLAELCGFTQAEADNSVLFNCVFNGNVFLQEFTAATDKLSLLRAILTDFKKLRTAANSLVPAILQQQFLAATEEVNKLLKGKTSHQQDLMQQISLEILIIFKRELLPYLKDDCDLEEGSLGEKID